MKSGLLQADSTKDPILKRSFRSNRDNLIKESFKYALLSLQMQETEGARKQLFELMEFDATANGFDYNEKITAEDQTKLINFFREVVNIESCAHVFDDDFIGLVGDSEVDRAIEYFIAVTKEDQTRVIDFFLQAQAADEENAGDPDQRSDEDQHSSIRPPIGKAPATIPPISAPQPFSIVDTSHPDNSAEARNDMNVVDQDKNKSDEAIVNALIEMGYAPDLVKAVSKAKYSKNRARFFLRSVYCHDDLFKKLGFRTADISVLFDAPCRYLALSNFIEYAAQAKNLGYSNKQILFCATKNPNSMFMLIRYTNELCERLGLDLNGIAQLIASPNMIQPVMDKLLSNAEVIKYGLKNNKLRLSMTTIAFRLRQDITSCDDLFSDIRYAMQAQQMDSSEQQTGHRAVNTLNSDLPIHPERSDSSVVGATPTVSTLSASSLWRVPDKLLPHQVPPKSGKRPINGEGESNPTPGTR